MPFHWENLVKIRLWEYEVIMCTCQVNDTLHHAPSLVSTSFWAVWSMFLEHDKNCERCCDLQELKCPNNGLWISLAVTLHALPVPCRVSQILSLLQDYCDFFFLRKLWNKFCWQDCLLIGIVQAFPWGWLFLSVPRGYRVQDWVACDRKTSIQRVFHSKFYA